MKNPEIKNRTTMTVTVPILVKDSLEHGLSSMKSEFEITLDEYAGLLLSGVIIRNCVGGKHNGNV